MADNDISVVQAHSSDSGSGHDASELVSSKKISPSSTSTLGASGVHGGLVTDTTRTAALHHILFPADAYTEQGVYWADLPYWKRWSWTTAQDGIEARRELAVLGKMFREDPLSPFAAYFRNFIIPGCGLLVEGFTLFSVGNLTVLFKLVWPQCWSTHNVCTKNWTNAVDYLEIIGIIIGQILVGWEGDFVGRKFGMVQDAMILSLGSVMLTAMWGTSLQGWVICYAFSLMFYSVGVGGEYPMTSTYALSKSQSNLSDISAAGRRASMMDRLHRGRKVALAFTCQGLGQLLNQGILILALLVFHHGSLHPPFSETSAQWTFRFSFAFILPPTLFLLYLRYYKLSYDDKQVKETQARNTSGYNWASLKMAGGWYWHRLVGTALVWAINDVVFYGAKIFSGTFIGLVTGSQGNLQATWLYNLLNIGVSLVGYYLASLTIDNKMMGRKWLQTQGLLWIFVIFLICAVLYPQLTTKAGSHGFMALYFVSSFFTQFGPNTTSFLIAAEAYPSGIRSTAHGVSAATGKVGALFVAVLFNYIENRAKFWLLTWLALVAAVLTLVFVPDTAGLDLREQEKYWQAVCSGRPELYHGVAVHPRHLSMFERVVLKRHLAYDAELDFQDKIKALQEQYHQLQSISDKEGGLSPDEKEFLAMGLFDGDGSGSASANEKLGGAAAPVEFVHPSRLTHRSALADFEKNEYAGRH